MTRTEQQRQHIEIMSSHKVEVVINPEERVVLVNVDGICRLHCHHIGHITVSDDRQNPYIRFLVTREDME